jgi:hypothetical protein
MRGVGLIGFTAIASIGLMVASLVAPQFGAPARAHATPAVSRAAAPAPQPGAPARLATPLSAPMVSLAEKKNLMPGTVPISGNIAKMIEQGFAAASFVGNGRDRLAMSVVNRTNRTLRTWVEGSQIFESELGRVMVARTKIFMIPPGGSVQEEIVTAALSSKNQVGKAPVRVTAFRDARMEALAIYLERNPQITRGSIQTAILSILENLPLGAFARFPVKGVDVQLGRSTDSYRVDSADIVQCLGMLRELGVSEERLALSVDPQLQVESMIDPLARAFAKRHYGITDQAEWAYWKQQLLSGDAATRHYALYGIARFYPDIALQMLPAWAREDRTNTVFRVSAIQALAETNRPEAATLLRHLIYEFGDQTDLGRSDSNALRFLEARLNRPTIQIIPFRLTPPELLPISPEIGEIAAG